MNATAASTTSDSRPALRSHRPTARSGHVPSFSSLWPSVSLHKTRPPYRAGGHRGTLCPVDVWGLGARYCVRQTRTPSCGYGSCSWRSPARHSSHAGAEDILRPPFFCFLRFAPWRSASLSSTHVPLRRHTRWDLVHHPAFRLSRLTTFTCLSHRALNFASMWTIVAVSCSAALGLVAWGRSGGKTAALRACLYIGAALLLLIAATAAFGWLFGLSWCSSSRLFSL